MGDTIILGSETDLHKADRFNQVTVSALKIVHGDNGLAVARWTVIYRISLHSGTSVPAQMDPLGDTLFLVGPAPPTPSALWALL